MTPAEVTDEAADVGAVADFPPGTLREVAVRGRQVVVARVGTKFYAFSSRCPHRAGPLAHGHLHARLEADQPGECVAGRPVIGCSWHGWEFDLETGEALDDHRRLRKFDISVIDGRVVID